MEQGDTARLAFTFMISHTSEMACAKCFMCVTAKEAMMPENNDARAVRGWSWSLAYRRASAQSTPVMFVNGLARPQVLVILR
jgi:hypothetical protein